MDPDPFLDDDFHGILGLFSNCLISGASLELQWAFIPLWKALDISLNSYFMRGIDISKGLKAMSQSPRCIRNWENLTEFGLIAGLVGVQGHMLSWLVK